MPGMADEGLEEKLERALTMIRELQVRVAFLEQLVEAPVEEIEARIAQALGPR